ncbi:hypothetical protein PIROE2DRAFT_15405 [Piromyces sp. E2]|nr:hypothetical protein PIROE2DRAFT_15405 [Piromyces sp. E2]|eukprot:OUM59147.1 hypothetical protein PIROE2DRAFT_15405 [Piromyces sp. E2]
MSKDQINIELIENNSIIISEDRAKKIKNENSMKINKMVCQYGKIKRSFIIPENANLEKIEDKMENGVDKLVSVNNKCLGFYNNNPSDKTLVDCIKSKTSTSLIIKNNAIYMKNNSSYSCGRPIKFQKFKCVNNNNYKWYIKGNKIVSVEENKCLTIF